MGVSNDGDLMFQCECNEPEGKIVRSVYKVVFTPQTLDEIYNKAAKFRTLMGWEIPSREHFVAFFLHPKKDGSFDSRGLCARVDDYIGLFWLTDINYDKPPFDASIHYTFFDRRHRGRVELCRAAIDYVFRTYEFERLWTQVPLYMSTKKETETRKEHIWSVLNFVERIGFRKEGRLKNKMMYKNNLFDANLYALTKNEALSGEAYRIADLKYTGKNSWAQGTQITEVK